MKQKCAHNPMTLNQQLVSFLFLLVLFKEYAFPLHSYIQGAHKGREATTQKRSESPVHTLLTLPQGKNALGHILRLICIFHQMNASNLKVPSDFIQSPSFRNNSIPFTMASTSSPHSKRNCL